MAVAVTDERKKDPAETIMADIVSSWNSLSIREAVSWFGSDWQVVAKNFAVSS